jgi:exodeoxyribonuclease VII large subunit
LFPPNSDRLMSAAPKLHPEAISVSDLTAQLRDLVEGCFPSVWVAGEISNFTRAASGHWYFSLKDSKAQLKAAMFRGLNLRMRFEPRDGLEVLARGRLTIYEPRGDYQLIVEEIQPRGIGAAELALRQLKEKLLAKGYFEPKRKRGLPRFPNRVGIITSASGAAVRDMVELFTQRWPLTELIIHPSRVQGEGAASEVAAAVRLLNHLHANGSLQLDAIILGRGGGSIEDLWAFNEEIIADAIFLSAVPIVSAVGHEVDVTIADLVADHRAETPSAAVVALTPHQREMSSGLLELGARLSEAINHRLELARHRVEQLASRPAFTQPLRRVRDLEQRLDNSTERLKRAMNLRVVQSSERIASLAARLVSLSPLNVLTRGYSLTHKASGELVRSAAEVGPGVLLRTRLAVGELLSRVEEPEESKDKNANSNNDTRSTKDEIV